ncbi:unnamed protein product [Rotaria magnacalcarata]|uniref:Uncharacterized protein n=2 Tax=Rotaria magnacalcarata TaxID=392030 RepID=A0A8S2PIP5_9BILA|nr:unnamed protein product [Rotaria magnacalcarata]
MTVQSNTNIQFSTWLNSSHLVGNQVIVFAVSGASASGIIQLPTVSIGSCLSYIAATQANSTQGTGYTTTDDISLKLLLTTISTSSVMNNEQNEYINRLITIREKQAEIWNEQLMLEIRIHCKFLPQNFDLLENFISSIGYLPLNNNAKAIEIENKRYKIIQEAKRQWLNYFLNIYEIKIQEYEQQYQNEFIKLESLFSNNIDIINDKTMLNKIKEQTNNRINSLKKDIHDHSTSLQVRD